jgi:uncharacterized membrane protein YdjX (TVP38/TMEM64 family)
VYGFQRDLIHRNLQTAFAHSAISGALVYLVVGCVRGFTLIPSTYLALAAVAFFPPTPLLLMTLAGILVSSASIYRFSEALHLDQYFERRHARAVARLKGLLQDHELPIIIGWSFFPLAPTDAICYVCGALEINFTKFLVGILIGEGAISAIYIYLGDHVLRLFNLRL